MDFGNAQLPAPNTLDQLYSSNPGAFVQGQQFIQRGLQADDQRARAADLEYLFNQQMNPLKVQNQQIQNDQGLAQLPGMRADSRLKQHKAEVSAYTLPLQKEAELKKLMNDSSSEDLRTTQQEFQRLAYSQNPKERAIGEAGLRMSGEIIKERAKQEVVNQGHREVANINGETQRAVTKMQIDAGRFAPKNAGPGQFDAKGILQMAMAGKLNYEKAATMFQIAAQMEQDPQLKSTYNELAQRFGQAVLDKRPPDLKDIVDLTQLNIPVKPTQKPTTNLGGGAPAPVPAPASAASGPVRRYNPQTGKIE